MLLPALKCKWAPLCGCILFSTRSLLRWGWPHWCRGRRKGWEWRERCLCWWRLWLQRTGSQPSTGRVVSHCGCTETTRELMVSVFCGLTLIKLNYDALNTTCSLPSLQDAHTVLFSYVDCTLTSLLRIIYITLKTLKPKSIFHVHYLSNPDTNRYFPSHTHTTRAPLWPSGPVPS